MKNEDTISENVDLECPNCSPSKFLWEISNKEDSYICQGCKVKFTPDQLLEANKDKMNKTIEGMVNESIEAVVSELNKEINKINRRNRRK